MRTLKLLTAFLLLIQVCNAQSNFTKVDEWLDNNVKEMGGRTFLMIYKDGKIVYSNTVNEMSRKQKIVSKYMAKKQGKTANTNDYTEHTKIQIASCSKWLSAALVMTFIDEGKLSLNDTVGKWYPVLTQNGKGNITISQCLSHLTAIEPPKLKESIKSIVSSASMDDAINKIAVLKMEGTPGEIFNYSNTGLQIAAGIIEKISGKSFEVLFAERIAKQLNMTNTDFGNKAVPLPAGGASSTPQDYMNFLVMVLNKGTFNGKRILSETSIAEMQVNRVTTDVKVTHSPKEAGAFGYGFGEWVMESAATNNLTTAVTSPGLFGSFPLVDNKNKYCAFMLCYYVQSKGRGERYKELKGLMDEAVK